jgi:oxygen-independent coproporphyrinogen-3 oxidase
LPDDDRAADMYDMTQDICAAAGFHGYEVSNHAAEGCESIHNKIYWRYGDYAGIGPGAHGRLTLHGQRYATEAQLSPLGWLAQVNKTGNGDLSRTPLDADAEMSELLLMGLRMSDGVAFARVPRLNEEYYVNKINVLRDMGMVEISQSHLSVTPQGKPVLNAILRELLGA